MNFESINRYPDYVIVETEKNAKTIKCDNIAVSFEDVKVTFDVCVDKVDVTIFAQESPVSR